MELAKKPVYFLCNATAPTFRISVPKTENHYLFYKGQPYLVKYVLDIEFFDEHLFFDRVEPEQSQLDDHVSSGESAEEIVEDATGQDSDSVPEEKEDSVPERQPYSKEELQKMRKSDVRDILKNLAPEKSSPSRKENIINEVLKAQEGN